jgi:hypothetical protein
MRELPDSPLCAFCCSRSLVQAVDDADEIVAVGDVLLACSPQSPILHFVQATCYFSSLSESSVFCLKLPAFKVGTH